MNKLNTIILDFDRTLFDTDSFKGELINIFLNCGVNKNDFNNSYKISKPYDIKLHLNNLKISNNTRKLIFNNTNSLIKKSEKFLFPDTNIFMDFLNKNNFNIILVTYGSDSFQNLKLKYTNLRDKFNEIHITQQSKFYLYKYIVKKNEHDNIYVIDDLKENTKDIVENFPNINIIKINCKQKGKPKSVGNYFKVKNLKEAQRIILNLNKK